MAFFSKLSPTTKDLLRKRSEEEEERFERLSNPTYQSTDESEKRGVALLSAIFSE